MSLLLDALRPADTAGEAAAETEEEPLDARATLELLAPHLAAGELSIVPSAGTAAPGSDAETPTIDFAPELSEVAPTAPLAARPSLSVAGPTAAVAAAPVLTAPVAAPSASSTVTAAPTARTAVEAPANSPAPVAAPPAMSRGKKYGLLVAVLVALAGIAMVGKSLWPSGSSAVIDPERRVSQAPVSTDPAPVPAVGAVQVSAARPADQFAYTGNAPEIDLHDAPTRPMAAVAPATAAGAVAPETPRAVTRPAAAGSARTRYSGSALSVTRADGPSSIDRHVEAGYRALAAGSIPIAQDEYRAALELDPNNVDALLGAATAAARDGRSKAAAALYARALEAEPGNPDATAALAMLVPPGAAGEADESRLKIMIAGDDGGRPALHAALGGVYGADARWREAAQEYFVALGKDPGNPDLTFNVAASLDQNRDFAVALTYYRQALAFARQRPTQLDTHAIEQRIGQLQARLETRASGRSEAQ